MSPYKKGKALTLSLAEILFFTFHSSLAGDMFLTGLGKYLGFNDYHFGILNAIPLLGASSQVLWALLIIFYPSYRRLVLLGSFIARIAWFLSYFLPLYGNGNASHLFIFIGIASLFNSLFTLAWSVWLGEIIIRAPLKSQYFIDDIITCRRDDDRNRRKLSNFEYNLKPVVCR